ncbi:MAG: hypothetical protein Kow0056_09870 [Coriobacteriia bacterium]
MDVTVWCVKQNEFFGNLAGRLLDAPVFVDEPVPECERVHILGMVDPPAYGATLEATRAARERVVHWLGPDVLRLEYPGLLPEAIHLCDSEGLRRSLFERGVDAEVVPWPAAHHFPVTPLPDAPVVAVYFGGNAMEYCARTIAVVESMMPGVEFRGFMRGQLDEDEMSELVEGSRVFLRLSHHEGGALTAREFMGAGRRAVIGQHIPYARVVHPDDLLGIVIALRECLAENEPDQEAAEYWRERNDESGFRERVERAMCRPDFASD